MAALAKPRRLRPAECRTRPSSTAAIPFRFLDFSMLCRQEKFPSRYFRSVASVDGDAADFGTRPGLRSDGELPPAVEILSAFLDLSMLCKQENFPPAYFGAPRPSLAMRAVSERGAFVRRSARSAARPYTRCCGFEASETIPFPGPDSIFSSRCGAISGQLRPSLTMRPVSERGALLPSGGELRTARSRNGDRVRPSARSSWRWDEAVPRPWFGRREGRAERAVSKRKGMGRLGAENDDRLR